MLHGDPADPHVAWIEVFNLGKAGDGPRRIDVLWYPHGYTAAFTPKLVVMDPQGNVVGRDGDNVDGACVIEAPRVGRNVLGIGARDIRPLWPDGPGPAVSCAPFLPYGRTPLACDKAIEAATIVVPESHAAITAIDFEYGVACPSGDYYTDSPGYVVFTLAQTATPRQMFVTVRANESGVVTTTGPWKRFACEERPSAAPD